MFQGHIGQLISGTVPENLGSRTFRKRACCIIQEFSLLSFPRVLRDMSPCCSVIGVNGDAVCKRAW